MDYMNDLHEMCGTLGRALKEANSKISGSGGKVTAGDVDYIDKLTHGLKSVKTTIAMIEAEGDGEYCERYSRDGSYRRGYSRNDYRGGSYEDGSYARGRNARRDSMGRYSREYSRDGDDFAEELRDLMNSAPDDHTRQEMQRLLQKMESR